jgi:DNA polymerase-3 subunit delta'
MNFPLIGNERIQRNLALMIKNSKIPHAIILEGEMGLGKKTLAKHIAKAFLCGAQDKPCNICKSCHLLEVGSHPDLLFTVPDGASIKVDQIRNLRNEAYLTPMMSDGRVFIIDFADTMNENAQNALLKVLEEPPQKVCFILLCENADALLPTVRSRSVCFTLSPVALEAEGFEKLAALIKDKERDARALLIAYDGNIGKAVASCDEDTVVLSQIANEIVLNASEKNRFKVLQILQPFSKSKEQVPKLVAEIKNVISKEMQKKAVKEYSSFTYSKLSFAYDKLTEIEKNLPLNPSLSLVFCMIADLLT